MTTKTYWMAIRNNNIRALYKASGYDMSARFIFSQIPRTISVNSMVSK